MIPAAMYLEMKSRCEKCGSTIAADADAYICSYECTFCGECASTFNGSCPNCAGELIRRPKRKTPAGSPESPEPTIPVHPRSWLIWALSFGVWTLVALAAAVTIYQFDRLRHAPVSFANILGLEFSQILSYAPLTPFVFGLALRYPIQRGNWVRRSLLHFGAALLFCVAHVILRGLTYGIWDSRVNGWVSAIWDSRAHAFHIRWDLFETLFFLNVVDDITGTYVPIVLIGHIMSYYQRFRERELRTSQLEVQLAKAHLHALKSQLQPHFLFNTLHSISSLMLTDVHAADRMMTRLSDLLRMSLENDGAQVSTLRREVEFVNGFLEIEKVRFQDRLNVRLEIAPDTLDAEVPHLLLQPLVENAVKHGMAKHSGAGEIRITALQDGPNLEMRVINNGPRVSDTTVFQSKTGLGLKATRERLLTLYGDNQSIQVCCLPEGGVEVSVRIPFRAAIRPLGYEVVSDAFGSAR